MAICGSSKRTIPSTQGILNTESLSNGKKIACRNIAIIWATSLGGAAPLVSLTRINHLEFESELLNDSAWCGLPYNEPDKRWELVMLASTVLFFLIPLVLISCLYFRIGRKLHKATQLDSLIHSEMQLADHASSRKMVQSRKIVIRMLGKIVFFLFFDFLIFKFSLIQI